MTEQDRFNPRWITTPPEKRSYRAIFKMGGQNEFKHPSSAWYAMLKNKLGLTDSDFQQKIDVGNEPVTLNAPPALESVQIEKLITIIGKENVSTDIYNRAKYSHGQMVEEILDLRDQKIRSVTDVVVHPRHKEDVSAIVAFCNQKNIPIYVYGGGSSVTKGVTPKKGGVTLVLTTHMNQLLELNETNQTATVQPGMMGPDYEAALNEAPARLHAERSYTCGHFPQSFEISSVGGWVVTLGSGQASTYYGDAYHLVLAQEYVTPAGDFKTFEFSGTATGPKVNDIMKGSEGAYGILVELTLRIYRYQPQNRQYFSFMFPSWEKAVAASREIMQA